MSQQAASHFLVFSQSGHVRSSGIYKTNWLALVLAEPHWMYILHTLKYHNVSALPDMKLSWVTRVAHCALTHPCWLFSSLPAYLFTSLPTNQPTHPPTFFFLFLLPGPATAHCSVLRPRIPEHGRRQGALRPQLKLLTNVPCCTGKPSWNPTNVYKYVCLSWYSQND